MSDLQQRRAIITHTQSRGRNTVIDAQAPLANLFGYSNAMRGLSQGRATCTMGARQLRSRPAGGPGEFYGLSPAWAASRKRRPGARRVSPEAATFPITITLTCCESCCRIKWPSGHVPRLARCAGVAEWQTHGLKIQCP